MSLLSAIQNKQAQVASAYTVCGSKGATLPAAGNRNLTNLADAIDTITPEVPINQRIEKLICSGDVYTREFETVSANYTAIPANKFKSDETLVSAFIPNTVTSIGTGSFSAATNLNYVNLENITSIGDSSFYGDTNLKMSLNMPNLTTIVAYAFKESGILSVDNLGNVSSMTWGIFQNCLGLRYAKLPSTLSYINSNVFGGCTSLKEIDFSDISHLNSYGADTCSGCINLTTVHEPQSADDVGVGSFYNCSSLTGIDLTGIINVNQYAFFGCSSLDSVSGLSGTNNIQTIGTNAFYHASLANVSDLCLPNLTNLGGGAFEGCGFTTVSNLGSITELSPSIMSCPNLTSIVLPSTLTNINNWALCWNSLLTTVTVLATTPPNFGGGSIFAGATLAHIYVPAASVSDYQNATGWSAYASIISAIPS